MEVEVGIEHHFDVAREVFVSDLVVIEEVFSIDAQTLRPCIELLRGPRTPLPDNP